MIQELLKFENKYSIYENPFDVKQIMLKCAKCNNNTTDGTFIVEGGILFKFCQRCANLLAKAPPGNIHDFLGPNKVTRISSKFPANKKLRDGHDWK